MEILSENDLIRIAWTTTGFSTDSQRYAVKLLLRVGQFTDTHNIKVDSDGDLITLLTDYQHLYLDRVPLAKTFTAINAKLSAPDAVLLTKISGLFTSESAKSELSTSSDSVEHDSITISLENTSGKRNFKWKFEGRLISDHGQSVCVAVHSILLRKCSSFGYRSFLDRGLF
ncbi:unnamed protein product [Anisakis simplex]|uniref:DOMON domain-containing protein n=1 Tax=Anisakis simplex TaxID=6269 RepID=A0A0M3K7P5_ANISI|nr:unnamed protein product [Anisakis simplex]